MPYRCQECMNTFKTLALYNKHATDCRQVKAEQGPLQRLSNSSVVIRRTLEDSAHAPEVKKPRLVGEVRIVKEVTGPAAPVIKEETKPTSPTTGLVDSKTLNPVTLVGFRAIKCEECGAGFDNKQSLDTHRETHKARLCDECEEDFSWPDSSHQCYYTQYKLRYISGDIIPAF